MRRLGSTFADSQRHIFVPVAPVDLLYRPNISPIEHNTVTPEIARRTDVPLLEEG